MSRSLGLVAADAASDGEPLLGAASQSLRVANAGDGMDLAAAEAVAAGFLRALGIGLDSPHLRATPMRMGRAWAEMLTPRPFVMTTFPNEEGYDQLVVARDIAFRSVSEHHLLPFTGPACVAYLPGPDRRPVQARPGGGALRLPPTDPGAAHQQVADFLQDRLAPRAVGVVMAAEHSCMTLRGAPATGSSTVTSALLGTLRSDPRSRQEFLSLTRAMS